MSVPLRICLIASSRFPISEPFAGGLEAHTAALAGALRQRGHRVTLFAAKGSAHGLDIEDLPAAVFRSSRAARRDVGATPAEWLHDHHAYLTLMLRLAHEGSTRFDVIHNNSLHHLPLAMASMVDVPMVTTLHTPPVDWLESAVSFVPASSRFVAVSQATSTAWSHVVSSAVVLNGVDTSVWAPGPGGGGADVWSGRVVPEKGAHLAARSAQLSGRPLVLAGPLMDPAYFERELRPLLSDRIRYIGHLPHSELVRVVRAAPVAIVTPCWDEPYGLVAAEALACGTPVAAFSRGALVEIVDEHSGRLAQPGDVCALARATLEASHLDRTVVRRQAVARLSLDRMVSEYETIYKTPISTVAGR